LKNQRAAAARLAARSRLRVSISPLQLKLQTANSFLLSRFGRTTVTTLLDLLKKSTLSEKIQRTAPIETVRLHFAFGLSSLILVLGGV
jgi:hypothetical protein